MKQVFLATRNAGKMAELSRILAPLVDDVEVLGIDDVNAYDEPSETEPTFEGNALIKARAGAHATGLVSLADDSGLCVEALNGMPGVLSARWSGPPKSDRRNSELLLHQLADVPDEHRGARFECAVAIVVPGGREWTFTGQMPGRIGRRATGDGGFGYDPVFVPAGERRTSAQLAAHEKDAISHRGRALRAAAPVVVTVLEEERSDRWGR